MNWFTHTRKWLTGLVACIAFFLATTNTAVARTTSGSTLPEPVPLVMMMAQTPVEAPIQLTETTLSPGVASSGDMQTAIIQPDIPIHIPAQTGGKALLVILAIVGIVLLLGIGFVVFTVFTLLNNEI